MGGGCWVGEEKQYEPFTINFYISNDVSVYNVTSKDRCNKIQSKQLVMLFQIKLLVNITNTHAQESISLERSSLRTN